ncbi:DIX domain protein (macronuclear) [Tetrahymena thermophila SB210]|uniref:DIX domain protein n=1 Tax=Tetrahymena thermophila (strain SB210) TaxID=312017 RepID=Q23DS7_TETTS|nr:DIX domain protein [Tetrahymena thermophila SB210]EAR94336.2 DIX domain protein [Tetrahymena thermophila SB210]|eukprot:XP_001014609.2 DIX domain protein [Tetrahymena thermophila SB210]
MSKVISNVFYHIPQDKDDPDIPNVFCVPKSQEEIRLADIKSYFPLNGQYIFRFKYRYNNQVVWMDIPENSKKLPIYEGRIFLKATRVQWGEEQKKVEPEQVQVPVQSLPPQQAPQQQQKQQPQQEYIDFFGEEEETQKQQNQQSTGQYQGTNLLDF